MTDYGYALEINLVNDGTRLYSSEHFTSADALQTVKALGYGTDYTLVVIDDDGNSHYSMRGYDHVSFKLSRLDRPAVPHYDFVVSVRITGIRNGWEQTILDTPKFVMMSNATSGSIYTYASARSAVFDMFKGLMHKGDEFHFSIFPLNITDM